MTRCHAARACTKSTYHIELDLVYTRLVELIHQISPQRLEHEAPQLVALGRIARLALGDVVRAVVLGEDDLFPMRQERPKRLFLGFLVPSCIFHPPDTVKHIEPLQQFHLNPCRHLRRCEHVQAAVRLQHPLPLLRKLPHPFDELLRLRPLVVPILALHLEVRRVCHHRVHAVVSHAAHDLQCFTVYDLKVHWSAVQR